MNLSERIHQSLASDKFFWVVMLIFGLQTLWLVFSAAYPMAFDEAYHLGAIRIYAQQWLPFLAEHPKNADAFAVVHRYPSYLFHYLLSFPYRIIAVFSDSQYIQVVLLRLINVGMFALSLVMFRRLFLKVGVSKALSNVSLLLFTLIPIVPLLAAHINYDNMLMLLVAWILLVTAKVLDSLQNRSVPVRQLLILAVLFVFTSMVKYAVLPILAAIAAYVLVYGLWIFRRGGRGEIKASLVAGWRELPKKLKIILPVLILIGGVLFFERYGLNLVRYQAFIPKCDEVLTVEQCMQFGPYERNFEYRQLRDPDFTPSITYHSQAWLRGMWYRLFFMINGDLEVDRYQNFAPLPLPALTATAIGAAALAAFIRRPRAILKGKPVAGLLIFCGLLYIAVLWQHNYQGYVSLGRTAALNGRYLLIILLPLAAVMGLSLSKLLKNKPKAKTVLAIAVIVLFLQGGGLISFIVRSNPNWYWENETVQQVNVGAQRLIKPLVFGSDREDLRFILP